MVRSNMQMEAALQPTAWREVQSRITAYAPLLPGTGVSVALVGCGTSMWLSCALAALREEVDEGETRGYTPSLWPDRHQPEVAIFMSRTGTTTETVDALRRVSPGTRTVAIVMERPTPLSDLADDVIHLEFVRESALVQTIFPTTVLMLFRLFWGCVDPNLAEAAEHALAKPIPDPGRFDHFVFLADGWVRALAGEAGLKVQEATALWTEAHVTSEYRHGPITAASSTTLVWALTPIGHQLREAIEATGATVVNAGRDPVVELACVYQLAADIAVLRGRDTDAPPHLHRSVILQEGPT